MQLDIARLHSLVRAAVMSLDFLGQLAEEEFLQDCKTQEAIRSTLITLGDMAKLLSPGTREELREVPRHKVAGMRNLIVHNYDGIDWRIVYHVVRVEIPPIIERISCRLESLPKG